jgi:hypothetical protein
MDGKFDDFVSIAVALGVIAFLCSRNNLRALAIAIGKGAFA